MKLIELGLSQNAEVKYSDDEVEAQARILYEGRQLNSRAKKMIDSATEYLQPLADEAGKYGFEVGVMSVKLMNGSNSTIKADLLIGEGVSKVKVERCTKKTPYTWIQAKVLL